MESDGNGAQRLVYDTIMKVFAGVVVVLLAAVLISGINGAITLARIETQLDQHLGNGEIHETGDDKRERIVREILRVRDIETRIREQMNNERGVQ